MSVDGSRAYFLPQGRDFRFLTQIGLFELRGSWPPLWIDRDVAGPTMEVGAVVGLNDLEAIRYGQNGRHLVTVALGQASHTALAATRAP